MRKTCFFAHNRNLFLNTLDSNWVKWVGKTAGERDRPKETFLLISKLAAWSPLAQWLTIFLKRSPFPPKKSLPLVAKYFAYSRFWGVKCLNFGNSSDNFDPLCKEQEVERNPLCFCLLKLSRKEGVVHLRMVQPKGFFEPQLDGRRLVGLWH